MNSMKQVCVVGLSALVFAIGMAGPAEAVLIDQLDGTVLDTDLNIFWLKDANTAATNTFGVGGITASGFMAWDTANDWITAMNTATYLGFTDWRQPTTTQPDASCTIQNFGGFDGQSGGFDCTGSEMGHLFNVEMVTSAAPGLFSNVQAGFYWSGTEFAPNPNNAWVFNFSNGSQSAENKGSNVFFAWAVRPIPEPSTILLLGTGLAGLVAWRMRKGRA